MSGSSPDTKTGGAARNAAPIGNPLHDRHLQPPAKGIKGMLRSRPVRKYRKNKLAMAALAVIVAYIAVGVWVFATDAVNDLSAKIGEQNQGVLDGRPLLGMFLRSSTAARVAPAEVAGFGVRQSGTERLEHYDFMLARASASLDNAKQVQDDPEAVDRAIRDAALGERTLGPQTIEGIEEVVGRARERFAALDRIKLEEVALRDIEDAAIRFSGFEAKLSTLLAEGGSEDDVLFQREELALTLDEIVAGVESYQRQASEDDSPSALAEVDLDPLRESVDALFGPAEEGEPLYNQAAFDSLISLVAEAEADIESRLPGVADAVEPVINELYPDPDGVRGLVYDFKLLLGTDKQGRSILVRAVYSAKIAIQVGLVTGVVASLIGALLGAAAGYFGGWVDNAIIWVYSTLSSIPYIVLLVVLAFAFQALPELMGVNLGETLMPLYIAFGLTYWIGPCRVVRGEAMKIKGLDYIQAAQSIGVGKIGILVKHIIPNTLHLVLINFSLLFIAAIKGEVILTFLGLGLKNGASWGIMIDQSQDQVLNGFFWQIGAATVFMFVLVLAFNIFTDALQDAFDPKHIG